MKKRRVLVFSVIFLATAAAVIVSYFLYWGERRFTKQHLSVLKNGMTRLEVAEALGVPPGDYADGKQYIDDDLIISWFPEDKIQGCWCGEDGAIVVSFDENGRVWNTTWFRPARERSLWQRFNDWIFQRE